MPKRSRTPKDENVTAFEIVGAATEDESRQEALAVIQEFEKAGFKIIPDGPDDAAIGGPWGMTSPPVRLFSALKKYWVPILEILAERGDERANAALRETAALLGRLGGLKGGKARAKKLSAKKRTEIARKAANLRWKKRSLRKP